MFNIFKNQYILTDDSPGRDLPLNFLKERIGGYTVYHDLNLKVTARKIGQSEILLLGFILNPLAPGLSDEEILDNLIADAKYDTETLLKELQKYSGRFVIFFKCKGSFISINDSCGLRQIYFNTDGPFCISSSPELILSTFGYHFQIENNLSDLFSNKYYIKKESPWYKDSWYDSRIKKVLPNHYLDINDRSIRRIVYYYTGPENHNEILEYAKSILTGSIEAIHNRYDNVMQPVTAGWDTRILLGSSRKVADRTCYYLFDSSDEQFADRIVATRLSKKLGIEFRLIQAEPLNEEFGNMFRKRFAIPRILEKTAHIQWHFYNSQKSGTININGNGGEIARCYYDGKSRNVTVNDLTTITGFGSIFKDDMIKWISESKSFSEISGIGNLDLFYWEHRMGNWGSMFPYEQDIAIEEFSPFNNRNLLYSLLKIDPSKRRSPDYTFFRELIEKLWSETLAEPFNPVLGLSLEWRLKKLLKNSPVIVNTVRMFKGMS